jgi:branched-chain amino acid transport system ATP-binding protein
MHSISGIVKPQSGSITFLGRHLDRMPAHRLVELGLSLVPEGRHIFPRMSVLDNLHLGSMRGEAKSRRKETLESVFELFPVLRDRHHQQAGTLSGGEQQMLAIARGLMARPKLLMLDEPSLGLAPMIVYHIFEILEKIAEDGMTLLVVEQNVHEALELSDRAYVIEQGHITLQGASEDLLVDDRVREAFLGI